MLNRLARASRLSCARALVSARSAIPAAYPAPSIASFPSNTSFRSFSLASHSNTAAAPSAEEEQDPSLSVLYQCLLTALHLKDLNPAITIFEHIKDEAPVEVWQQVSQRLMALGRDEGERRERRGGRHELRQEAAADKESAIVTELQSKLDQHGIKIDLQSDCLPASVKSEARQHWERYQRASNADHADPTRLPRPATKREPSSLQAYQSLYYLLHIWQHQQSQHPGQPPFLPPSLMLTVPLDLDPLSMERIIEAYWRLGNAQKVKELAEQYHTTRSFYIPMDPYKQVMVMDAYKDDFPGLKRYFETHVINEEITSDTVMTPYFRALAKRGQLQELEQWFERMQSEYKVKATASTYSVMIQAFDQANNMGKMLEYYERFLSSGQPCKDHGLFECMINAHLTRGDHVRALAVLQDMRGAGNWAERRANAAELTGGAVAPLSSPSHSFSTPPAPSPSLSPQLSLAPTPYIYARLLQYFDQADMISSIAGLIEDMRATKVKPTIVVWNIALAAYARRGKINEVLDLYREMRHFNLKPNASTEATVLNAFAEARDVSGLYSWYQSIPDKGLPLTLSVYNAVLKGLAKFHKTQQMSQIYDTLKENNIRPSVHTMPAMINGQRFIADCAFYYKEMEDLKLKPDPMIFSILMRKYLELEGGADKSPERNANAASNIRSLIDAMTDFHLRPSVFHYSSLLTALGHAGQLDEMYKAFERMQASGVKPNLVVYNTLIQFATKHQRLDDVVAFLRRVQADGLIPGETIFRFLSQARPEAGFSDPFLERVFAQLRKQYILSKSHQDSAAAKAKKASTSRLQKEKEKAGSQRQETRAKVGLEFDF